jgi:hypothetical protein
MDSSTESRAEIISSSSSSNPLFATVSTSSNQSYRHRLVTTKGIRYSACCGRVTALTSIHQGGVRPPLLSSESGANMRTESTASRVAPILKRFNKEKWRHFHPNPEVELLA